jgi:hypothetical protein
VSADDGLLELLVALMVAAWAVYLLVCWWTRPCRVRWPSGHACRGYRGHEAPHVCGACGRAAPDNDQKRV